VSGELLEQQYSGCVQGLYATSDMSFSCYPLLWFALHDGWVYDGVQLYCNVVSTKQRISDK
jgi:hypothetical protein